MAALEFRQWAIKDKCFFAKLSLFTAMYMGAGACMTLALVHTASMGMKTGIPLIIDVALIVIALAIGRLGSKQRSEFNAERSF